VDYNADGGKKAIFKIHGDGKSWSHQVDKEKGSYDYLMGADIDHVRSKPTIGFNMSHFILSTCVCDYERLILMLLMTSRIGEVGSSRKQTPRDSGLMLSK